jgi:hypothetical protein
MDKVWSFLIKTSPWLLLVLPIQLLTLELPATRYLSVWLIILVLVLILYRTTQRNELLVDFTVLLIYSIFLGVIAENRECSCYLTQHLTWVVMMVYLLACTQVVRTHVTAPFFVEKPTQDWRWYASLLGVFLAAIALRMQNIQFLPVFGGDEANAALYGIAVRDGVIKNLFGSGWYEFPAMWFVIPALTHTLLPDGMLAVRIHSILIGSLTTVALVWAIRPLLPLWLATSAGVTLAFFGAHIFFSQIGLNNIYDGFFLVVMIGFLTRQGERITTARWGLIGLVIGLALYGYTSARLLPVIFGLWVLLSIWQHNHLWREYLYGFLLVATIAGVIAAPLLVHYYYRPDNMVAPMVRTSFFSQDIQGLTLFERIERDTGRSMSTQLWDYFVASVGAITVGASDGWYRFSRGLVGPIIAIPFVIGIVSALITRKALMMRLAVMAVLLFLLMSVLSHPVGSGQRLVTVLPLVAMLSAYGLAAVDQFLRRYVPAWLAVLSVVAVLALGSYVNCDAYFRQFLQYEGGVGDGNSRVADFYGQHARRLPAGTVVDVYISDHFQQRANASIIYNSRHLDYREVTAELPARADATLIIVPIGHIQEATLPVEFIRSEYVAKPSNDILLTVAYHPALQRYFADLVIDRVFPPRFGQ